MSKKQIYKRRHSSDVARFSGRILGLMNSRYKYDEYRMLIWYIMFGMYPRYGSILAVHRFHKNLKFRKYWINAFKNR